MKDGVFASAFHLPRHSFSPRDVARPASLWRAFQDVAVDASAAAGWPPERYRLAETAFVVREMTVVHHRESTYGEALSARTWVSRLRRRLLSTREVRISGAAGPIASTTQEWVHVSAQLKPLRAAQEMADAFPIREDLEAQIEMPAWVDIYGAPVHRFAFTPWQTWMDPLGHINHPMYVDFADEALARILARAAVAESQLMAVAETAIFRVPIDADKEVEIQSQLIGMTADGAAVIAHRLLGAGDLLHAQLTTVRTLANEPQRLREALS